MAGAAALGLWAGVAAALADATLTVAGSPRVVPPPSGARVFLWALLAYPAAGAVACALLARAFGAARRAEPARARAVALAAVSSTALLAVAVAAARRWEAGVPSPAAYAGTAAAFALAAAALTPATWRAVRRGPSRRGVAIALGAWAALAAGAFALASRPVTSPAAGPERPVIVLVTVDTLRADALGCYGNPSARTPAIDRLAAEGARFADAQAQSSWTLTAHASIMTGLTVAQHGADAVSLRLSGDHETIAATLARRGFRTAAIVSSVYTGSRFGFARGFDRFDEEMAPAWTGLGACRLARLLGVAPRGWATSDERRAGPVAAAALDVLRRAGSGPLFLWLHFFDPHSDYDPPPPFDVARAGYSGPFDGSTIPLLEVNRGTRTIAPADLVRLRSLYDGEVAYLDSEIGALLAGLDRLGLAGRTAIVLTADHGESFHEHGTMLHESLYQEVLHVPLLLWRPGLVPAGRVVGATVRQMDVAPTVAELAGVPWAVPGSTARSLLPVALGSAEPPRPAPAERQVGGLGSPVRGEQVALVEWPWKLIADTGAAPQLFDLAADPLERNNLAWVERPRVDAMSAALAGERAPSGRPARPEPWLLRRLRSLGYVN